MLEIDIKILFQLLCLAVKVFYRKPWESKITSATSTEMGWKRWWEDCVAALQERRSPPAG
jgi:hypothetical protein